MKAFSIFSIILSFICLIAFTLTNNQIYLGASIVWLAVGLWKK